VAEAVAAAMDVREVAKKASKPKSPRKRRIFRQVNSETHAPFDQ